MAGFGHTISSRATSWLWCLCFLLLLSTSLHAQPFVLKSSSLAGGGGTSTGGVYSISGTVGQPDTGQSTGGSYQLEAGFWSVYSVIQTFGAPLLKLKRVGSTVEISWSTTGTLGFLLEETGNLAGTIHWSGVATPVSVVNNENVVTVSAGTGFHFFRLRKP